MKIQAHDELPMAMQGGLPMAILVLVLVFQGELPYLWQCRAVNYSNSG